MKLTKDQQQHVLNVINQRWIKERGCSICGEESWTIADQILELRPLGAKGEDNVNITPIITLLCTNCGQTHLLNPMKLGFQFNKQETSSH